ncbi:MAG: HEAT repeat domain-containing protein [Acidobacteriota bacterium]
MKEAKLAGSKSCEKCHPEHFQRWQDSVHSKMVQIPAPETVAGDFTADNRLSWKGYTYEMFVRDGKYFMSVSPPLGEGITYPVDYTVGSKRIQGYITRLPDGRLYLLPAYWHIPTQSWFDSSLIVPRTEEGVGVKQYWNTNCLACHATDLKFDFDPKTAHYSTEWLELSIGCEACHNPGSKHNEFFENKPLRDYSRKELNDTFISNQRYFDFVRSTELCVSCHGTKINYFQDYWPGDRAYDYFAPILMSIGAPDQQGEFYPDGRPTRFNHSLGFMGNKCFLEGKATCVSCHDGHSSENDSLLLVPKEQSNVLCLNCHQEKYGGTKLTEHTFHLPDSPGSRCFECHMGEVLERVMMHRRDHSLDNPIPENSIRFGVPNTCNENCHTDKTAEWSVRVLNQWYGDENRKKLLYASEAMWLAKAGDPRAIPLLVRALNDTNLRLTMRASAASFLGKQFGSRSKSALPSLIQQLGSESILLRLAAAEALGRIGDPKAVEPISRLLDHPTRVLRIAATSSLINLGIARLEGDIGQSLETAKAEYLRSLQNWPNVPEFRINIGNLHLLASRFEEAASEYQVALQLNPVSPEAWYYLGLARARMEQWEDALAAWSKLRETDPRFPNVDQLIRSARQQLKNR